MAGPEPVPGRVMLPTWNVRIPVVGTGHEDTETPFFPLSPDEPAGFIPAVQTAGITSGLPLVCGSLGKVGRGHCSSRLPVPTGPWKNSVMPSTTACFLGRGQLGIDGQGQRGRSGSLAFCGIALAETRVCEALLQVIGCG